MSADAALAGDYKDLKFVNNLDAPIYIEGYTVGKDIYFNIYGQETRPSNRKVTYESEVVSEEDPGTQLWQPGMRSVLFLQLRANIWDMWQGSGNT